MTVFDKLKVEPKFNYKVVYFSLDKYIAMNPEEIEEYCYLKDGTLSENRSGKIISMKDFRK